MSNRLIARALAIGLTMALLGACTPAAQSPGGSGSPGAETAEVSIGLDAFGGAVVVYAAQSQGFFEDHGIKATINTYSVGLDTLNSALAGTEDFGWAFDFGSLGAMQGDQLRYLATLTRTEPGFHQLAVTSAVAAPEDLEGKKMGIVAGTQQHYITVRYLEKFGIPVDSVELINFGTPLEIVAAMRTGDIDASWVFGQGVAEAQNVEGVEIIADDGEVLSAGRGLLIGTRRIVEEEPEVVKRVLEALIDAEAWVNESDANLDTVAEFIATELNVPVDGVLANISRANQTVSFDEEDLATLEEMATFRNEIADGGAELEVERYLGVDLLREVAPDRVTIPE